MAWREFDASTYPSLADCFADADAVKDTNGSVILLPGGDGQEPGGEYNGDGLTLPRNTHLIGAGAASHIICPTTRMKIGSFTGQVEISRVVFDDGLNVNGARNSKFFLCEFWGEVLVDSASFYNVFDTCRWRNLGTANALVTVDTNQNANMVLNARANCINGFVINSDGWNFVGGAIEGDGGPDEVLGVALTLNGNGHYVSGAWLEHGSNRTYGTSAVHLTENSNDCVLLGGRANGHLVDVLDEGGITSPNKVYPPYQRA